MFFFSAWFFIIGVVFCLLYAIIFIFYVYNWFVLRTKTSHRIISELIYILGLEPSQPRSIGEGSEDPIPPIVPKAESVESIYGFGHDEDKKWTFAGKKPHVAKVDNEKSPKKSGPKEAASVVSEESGIGTDVPQGKEVDQLG